MRRFFYGNYIFYKGQINIFPYVFYKTFFQIFLRKYLVRESAFFFVFCTLLYREGDQTIFLQEACFFVEKM